jgi:hypothetical protein
MQFPPANSYLPRASSLRQKAFAAGKTIRLMDGHELVSIFVRRHAGDQVAVVWHAVTI